MGRGRSHNNLEPREEKLGVKLDDNGGQLRSPGGRVVLREKEAGTLDLLCVHASAGQQGLQSGAGTEPALWEPRNQKRKRRRRQIAFV